MNSVVDKKEEASPAGYASSEEDNNNKVSEETNNENYDAECDDDCQYIFPQRLMSILSNEKNHDAICWLPHGRAFIIRNRKIFAEKIMPRFFPRKSKYSSFTRKLNRWNFVRVSSGPELGAYYHEFFLRDKPHLAAQMFCKNARTKIAMATDCKPSPTPMLNNDHMANLSPIPLPTLNPQTTVKQADAAADLFLQNQQLDPAMEFLLKQQLSLCQQQPMLAQNQLPQQQQQVNAQPFFHPPQQQMPQQQQPILAFGDGTYQLPPAMGFNDCSAAAGINNSNNDDNGGSNMNLWQQIQAQKQQEARMMQLRQLMALNLQRQKNRGKVPAKNFRASAA
mmetsp:Transcript_26008/g.48478  ORF Transcript_26008/g.48478 Transcript_26008/m.48478 type:complete len:336 (+) Transcript_26008:99-1106(+)|eukprot:CAMPEP_0178747014 /NCGR_PEP_ID=MMETSP0744-20121128/8100_1 /TAXON_ID=913974 /ORGANISM="Nitzschia punctata, Strain CCMP561" /LENGTH=335 /DNA_ID=CAMNT_0020400231 /DNA_START=88 /DNA_END=1095 /DNA_ORIENTATION=-